MLNDPISLLARAIEIDVSIAATTHASSANASLEARDYPYSQLQHIGFFLIFFFCAAAFLTWVLRIYGRISTRQCGWDDLLITIAMAMAVAETICFYFAMRSAYIGVHMVNIPTYVDFAIAQRWNYIAMILYNPILALVKTSLLLFILRLGGQKRKVRIAIISLLIFNLCQMIALFICCVFQCTPINYFWIAAAPGGASRKGKCIDQNAFLISTASLTIVTDVLVLILPFWIFLGLKLPLRVRVAIIGVFALGGVVTLLGILRLAWMVEKSKTLSSDLQKTDYTYDIRFTYAVIETNLAIITASAPALRPVFLKWIPNFFSAVRSSKSNYSPSRGRYRRSTARATNRTRGGTGARSSLRGPFPLREIKMRPAIRTQSPTNSEEEIMTYDGIMRTSDVTVEFDDVEAVPQAHLGLGLQVVRGRDG